MNKVVRAAVRALPVVLLTAGLPVAPLPPSIRLTNAQGATKPQADLRASTGAISGVVVDALTGRPVQGAIVNLTAMPGSGPTTATRQLTGRDGQFVFVELPASPAYLIDAMKFGYLAGGYGRKTPHSTTRQIPLEDGQWFADARISLWRPGSISGVITDEAGEPVVGAYVRLIPQLTIAGTPHLTSGPAVRSDDRGMYRLAGLLPGRYFIVVPSVQWTVPAAMPLLALSGVTPERAAAAKASGRDVPLRTDALIPRAGDLAAAIGSYPTPPAATGDSARVYPMTFYAQARTPADALAIDLDYAEDRTGVDIQIRPAAAVRVSGRVVGPADALANLTLRLLPTGMEGLGQGAEAATTVIRADGTFTFLDVPAGEYTLMARHAISGYEYSAGSGFMSTRSVPTHPAFISSRGGSTGAFSGPRGTMLSQMESAGSQSYSGRAPVTVGTADVSDLAITMERGIALSGRVVMAAKPGSAAPLFVMQAEPADGNPTLGQPRARVEQVGQSSTFTIEGLQPGGDYLLRPMGDNLIRSITWQGKDVTFLPFRAASGEDISGVVVTFTDQRSTVEGVVRDVQGRVAANASVIYFPVERERWSRYGLQPDRLGSTPVSAGGTFRIRMVPAGEYYLLAVEDDLNEAWKNPAFLETASRVATRMTLDWGEAAKVELRLLPIKR